MSIPSRFLEEVPSQLVENLSGRNPAWSTPSYSNSFGRRPAHSGDFSDRHYNYEDENQDAPRSPSRGFAATGNKYSADKPFVAPWMKPKKHLTDDESAPIGKNAEAHPADANSIDNIARFFGGKPGALSRPAEPASSFGLPRSCGATGLKKGQHVRHSKYGEGTVLLREGEGEDAKLTILFVRHGVKKLMEKFANLQKV
jgi:DNA helicase-2/ATP-dependent DNA helicase PcrA